VKKQTVPGFPPNDALNAFEPIIGVWNTEGTHGMIPDTTLHGRTSFSWHESGAFILMRSNIEEDIGIPEGIAIIGSDDTLGKYVMIYYDERGVSRNYDVSIQGSVLKWRRDAPDISQRYSLTISDDQQTMIGKGELSRDGSTWEKDLDLTYSKTKS
jgi:hypothetical protein